MKVAICGLGQIGGPMTDRLLAAGHDVAVFDPVPAAVEPRAAAGARVASSPADAAAGAEVVGLVVRNDAQVMAAVGDPGGVLEGAAPGTVVAVHSTVAVATVTEVARLARARGVEVVDAAVSGGVAGAAGGKLFVMCGGDPGVLARIEPVLASVGQRVERFGDLGAGMAAKLARNLAHYAVWVGLHESMALAEAAGLDLEAFADLVRSTGVPDLHELVLDRPTSVPGRPGATPPAARDLQSVVELGWKDLSVAMELARATGTDTTLHAAVRYRYGPAMGLDVVPPPADAQGS